VKYKISWPVIIWAGLLGLMLGASWAYEAYVLHEVKEIHEQLAGITAIMLLLFATISTAFNLMKSR